MNIIDMLAIAPYYITLFFMPGNSIKLLFWVPVKKYICFYTKKSLYT